MEKKIFGTVVSPIIWSLLSILLGILMIIYSGQIIDWVMVFAGAYLVIFGAIPIIRSLVVHESFPLVSVLSVLCGILLILFHGVLSTIMFVLLGLLLFLVGIQQLNHFLTMRRGGIRVAWFCYFYPVLAILAGVVAVWNPFALPETLIMFVGWCLVGHGFISLVGILVAMFCGPKESKASGQFPNEASGESGKDGQPMATNQ